MSRFTRREVLAVASGAVAAMTFDPFGSPAGASEETRLPIPNLIDTRVAGPEFDLVLQKSLHRFSVALATETWGISASFLGPVIRVRNGETIHPRVINRLDESSTLHWHGLMISSDVDGGPHNSIAPGAVWAPESNSADQLPCVIVL